MERLGRWCKVLEIPVPRDARTRRWEVYTKDVDDILGLIRWEPTWRQYVYKPSYGFVYNSECLRVIADFVDARTREHRTQVREAKRRAR